MVRVECKGLRKEFVSGGGDTIVAVDSVDLEVEDGTFVTILGPSGCGKTTLLRMLAGLETPTEGQIFYDDDDVTDWAVQDRRIGMVFQNIALFPYMTVRDNIEYGLKYTEATEEERATAAQEMAELLGIDDQLDDKPGQLSGGQRQRVALARALIRDPSVFLLDEPMAALDAELKVRLRTELKELHNEFQTTTFYVTHDQEEAMTLSEEVIVIRDGQIEQKTTPFELFEAPNSKFVAQFIGSPNINFFDAVYRDGQLEVETFERPVRIPASAQEMLEQVNDPERITIGVRPSAMQVVDDESAAYLRAEAAIHEQLGTETIIHLSTDNGEKSGVEGEKDVRIVGPADLTPSPGDEFLLRFELADMHIFDDVTGDALLNGLDEVESAINEEGKTSS